MKAQMKDYAPTIVYLAIFGLRLILKRDGVQRSSFDDTEHADYGLEAHGIRDDLAITAWWFPSSAEPFMGTFERTRASGARITYKVHTTNFDQIGDLLMDEIAPEDRRAALDGIRRREQAAPGQVIAFDMVKSTLSAPLYAEYPDVWPLFARTAGLTEHANLARDAVVGSIAHQVSIELDLRVAEEELVADVLARLRTRANGVPF